MRIRGECMLFVALSFVAGCQVVVGLSERSNGGASGADLAGGSDSGGGGSSAQQSQGGSPAGVLAGASATAGGGGALGVSGTGGAPSAGVSGTGGTPSAGAAGTESGGTDAGSSSPLKACPEGPYEAAKLQPGTAVADGVGPSGRLIGGATLPVAGNDFSFYGIRDSGGSLGFFKADRKGGQFSMAAKWAPAGREAMTTDRLVVGGSAQELWLLSASNSSVISFSGPDFSKVSSTMVTGYPTAIEHSVDGVWIAGKAQLERYTSTLIKNVFAYGGSEVQAPSGLATHLLPNGNTRVVMADATALKQVVSFEFAPTGKLVRTNKPLIKPIVAVATDCAGTTYASDGLDTWQISLNDEISTPIKLIPCKSGCDCPQITGLGFDDRNKLLATTSYTSCDPSALWEIDLNVPGKQTW